MLTHWIHADQSSWFELETVEFNRAYLYKVISARTGRRCTRPPGPSWLRPHRANPAHRPTLALSIANPAYIDVDQAIRTKPDGEPAIANTFQYVE